MKLPYSNGLVVYLSKGWWADGDRGDDDDDWSDDEWSDERQADWDTVLRLAVTAVALAPTTEPTASPKPTATMVPTTLSPTPLPTSLPLLQIKMLKDTSFVDSGESDNLVQSIIDVGHSDHSLDQMTSYTSGTLSAELDGFDRFVVPELENGDFYSALSAADVCALWNWVGEGRVLVVSGDARGRALALLNEVFGWSLSMGSTSSHSSVQLSITSGAKASITSAANGSAFASGPSALYGPNANYAMAASSIPSNGSSIYTYVTS